LRGLQARTESLEAQVALTAAQVQELQASQRQLEARNALLESVASNLTSDVQEASVVSYLVPSHTEPYVLAADTPGVNQVTHLCSAGTADHAFVCMQY